MSDGISSAPAAGPRPQSRLDIQALRALAVGGVLLYHLWPERLPGGFVGVDAFFVISGFLITSHLLRSATGAGLHIGRFWAQRARRLLPLAGTVLAATLVAALLVMPASTWVSSLRNIIASALYGQNWLLAADAVNYLSRDNDPPPTQHFWSLSAEEQFYIAWPILMLVAIWVGGRIAQNRSAPADRPRHVRTAAFVILAAVFVASLAVSLVLTTTDPALAYFATTTRAWEFAAGGLLAFAVPSVASATTDAGARLAVRAIASWAGYLILIGTMVLLPTDAPFPGVAALLPVGATVLCLAAGDAGRVWTPSALGRVRPIRYLGDLSYGIYLWHWPIIVMVPFVIGPLTTVAKLLIAVAAVALAAASKVLIEDPFRFRRFWVTPWWRGFIPAGVALVTVVAVAVGGILVIRATVPEPTVAAEITPLDPAAPTYEDQPLLPPIEARIDDNAGMYDCFDLTHTTGLSCTYGDADAPISIAVAGDSHIAVYLPALQQLAESENWRITTFVGLSCDAAPEEDCADGDTFVDTLVSEDFDLVLVSSYRASTTPAADVEGYWRELGDAGLPLLAIVDVPKITEASYACLDRSGGDPAEAKACTFSRADGLDAVPDRVGPIAAELGIETIDPTELFCDAVVCQNVIGNYVVYQDINSHLTRTVSLSLTDWLDGQISARLPQG